MKLLGPFLFGILIAGCRDDRLVPPETESTRQSTELGGKLDPDLIILPEGEKIKEVDLPVLEAAKLFEEYHGKRVIMTREIAETEISFSMVGPLTNREAGRYLQLVLLSEGIAMIPIPDADGVFRLIQAGPITSSGSPVTKFYTEVSQFSEDDELIIFRMNFKHLAPEDALKIFQAELGASSPSGTIAAVPNHSTLIITEKASLIRRMVEIQARIDVQSPGANQER